MPRQHVENTKEFWSENEAKRANKHGNKRIIYWPPFWNKVYYQILIKIMHTAQINNSCMKIHATLHNYVNCGQFLQRRFQFWVKQTWVSWQIEYKNYRGMKKEKVSQSGARGGFRNLFITFIQKTFTDFFPSTKIVTGDHSTDSTDIAKKWVKREREVSYVYS